MILKRVPALLVASRFFIAAYLIVGAYDGAVDMWFSLLFTGAFVSDIFDGVIARRLGVATPALRRWDGYADITIYTAVLTSLWFVYPEVIRAYAGYLVGLLSLQAVSWVYSLIKFGRITSYHSYLAKAWGLSLFIATVGIFAFHSKAIILFPIAMGFVSNIEDMIITSILPVWANDVWNIPAAVRLGKNFKKRQSNEK